MKKSESGEINYVSVSLLSLLASIVFFAYFFIPAYYSKPVVISKVSSLVNEHWRQGDEALAVIIHTELNALNNIELSLEQVSVERAEQKAVFTTDVTYLYLIHFPFSKQPHEMQFTVHDVTDMSLQNSLGN